MRLGLLGPVRQGTSYAQLEGAAEFLLSVHQVPRVIYLGDDDALDRMVEERARRLVGDDPSDDASWRRAAILSRDGSPDAIDNFIAVERQRRKLRALESLPRPALRTIEMIGDRVSVLIYDKALLDEEDIFPASVLIYGKNDVALAKRIGTRWFLAPGKLGPEGGVCVVEETGEDLVAQFFNADAAPILTERMKTVASAKLKVQGGA